MLQVKVKEVEEFFIIFLLINVFPTVDYVIIAQFQYIINIQLQTIDVSTRLQGINYGVCGVYSPEPRGDVYCCKLNFNISKLTYYRIVGYNVDHMIQARIQSKEQTNQPVHLTHQFAGVVHR